MNTEPICAGGLYWHVEPVNLVVSRRQGLRASIASAAVEAVCLHQRDAIDLRFSAVGFIESQFPPAIWLAALEVARELVERVAPVRGAPETAAATNPNPA